MSNSSRRQFLITVGAAATAGCNGVLPSNSDSGSDDTESRERRRRLPSDEDPSDTTPVTQFQYDAQNTGTNNSSIPTSVDRDWRTELSIAPHHLTVTDGKAIVVNVGGMVALDTEDGSELWKVPCFAQKSAMPAATSDTLYVPIGNPSQQGMRGIEANDLATGQLRWRAIIGVDVTAPPTLADGTLYVGGVTNQTHVFAVDATTGYEQWRTPLDQEITEEADLYQKFSAAPAPAVEDGTVYVGAGQAPEVVALDGSDGEELWQFESDAPISGDPTVYDGTIYAGSENGKLYALDPAGDERWSVDLNQTITAPVAVNDTGIYLAADGKFVRLSHDGQEEWTVEVDGDSLAPTLTDDAVVCADENGIFGLAPDDGTELWRYEPSERTSGDMVLTGKPVQPVVGNGRVYGASDTGRVYALENSGWN